MEQAQKLPGSKQRTGTGRPSQQPSPLPTQPSVHHTAASEGDITSSTAGGGGQAGLHVLGTSLGQRLGEGGAIAGGLGLAECLCGVRECVAAGAGTGSKHGLTDGS